MAEDNANSTGAPDVAERVFIQFSRAEAVASVLNSLIRWSGLVGIFYILYMVVAELSGTTTVADIGIEVGLLANLQVGQVVSGAAGVAGVGYGLAQRKLRRDTIERVQGRIISYEKGIDPGRTSSMLTPRGETRPEDTI